MLFGAMLQCEQMESPLRIVLTTFYCPVGGVQIESTSASLWQALGSCASSAGKKEFALSRALQLDPKNIAAWVSLGRLYAGQGEAMLAGRCFINARSHEPTAATIWEGMGALAASSSTGDCPSWCLRFHI